MQERYIPSQKETKEKEKPNPYVVSEDIQLLLQPWAESRGFQLPSKEFFTDLRGEFQKTMQQIFPSFEMVPEQELSEGINALVNDTGLIPVSLDRTYFQSEVQIDIARLVDEDLRDKGLGRRRDAPSLLQQFRNLQTLDAKEIVLVDDVIFSGGLLTRIINSLERIGLEVPIVCAGISIQEGIDVLNTAGKEVRSVRTYQNVIDEICERDFYPGVPLSGRMVATTENTGAPYILPFGNPGQWASIPENWQQDFSQFCIDQTLWLFRAIEEQSGKAILCSDLDRNVISLPRNNTRFIDTLKAI